MPGGKQTILNDGSRVIRSDGARALTDASDAADCGGEALTIDCRCCTDWREYSNDNLTIDPTQDCREDMTGYTPDEFFDDGRNFPPGHYRIVYIEGAYFCDRPGYAGGWAVDGDAVFDDGASHGYPMFIAGCYFYATQAEAEACALSRDLVCFYHAGGRIGVRAGPCCDMTRTSGSPNPTFKLQRCVTHGVACESWTEIDTANLAEDGTATTFTAASDGVYAVMYTGGSYTTLDSTHGADFLVNGNKTNEDCATGHASSGDAEDCMAGEMRVLCLEEGDTVTVKVSAEAASNDGDGIGVSFKRCTALGAIPDSCCDLSGGWSYSNGGGYVSVTAIDSLNYTYEYISGPLTGLTGTISVRHPCCTNGGCVKGRWSDIGDETGTVSTIGMIYTNSFNECVSIAFGSADTSLITWLR